MKSFEGKLEKGMSQKLGSLHSHNSPITLVNWFTNLADSVQKLGLDTIFRVPSSKGEIYVLQDWGELTSEGLLNWSDNLVEGFPFGDGTIVACPYDVQNLQYSGIFLLSSLTPEYKASITEELGPSPNGLEVLAYLIRTRLLHALDRQRKLLYKLTEMKLSKHPGENVKTFNVKLRDHCREIEQTGPTPRDLAYLVITCYISSQVTFFATKMLELKLKLERDPAALTWTQVQIKALDTYLALQDIWTPTGNVIQRTHHLEENVLKAEISELKQQLTSCNQQINALKLKSPMPQMNQTGQVTAQNNKCKKRLSFKNLKRGSVMIVEGLMLSKDMRVVLTLDNNCSFQKL